MCMLVTSVDVPVGVSLICLLMQLSTCLLVWSVGVTPDAPAVWLLMCLFMQLLMCLLVWSVHLSVDATFDVFANVIC